MNHEDLKEKFYTPLARYAHAIREEADQPHLPDQLQWVRDHAHPVVLAALGSYIHSDDFMVAGGRNNDGFYFSMYDADGDEVMRLTQNIERTGGTSGWLGDRRTGTGGIWMPGGESFEIAPFALASMRPSPFQDLRNVLKAVQVFGGDSDLDVQHRGTYISHSLLRSSRITEHYLFGGMVMTLSHRQKFLQADPFMQHLVGVIEDEFSDVRDMVCVRTHREAGVPEMAHFFRAEDPQRRDGEVLEEDAEIIIRPNTAEAALSTCVHQKTVMSESRMRRYVEEDDNVGIVASRLMQTWEFRHVYLESGSLDEKCVTFHVVPNERDTRVYDVKVKL
jgi:hypothetical protein